MKTITYPLKLTPDEHATIKRRAAAADLSIQKFVKYMAIDGSLPKPKKAK